MHSHTHTHSPTHIAMHTYLHTHITMHTHLYTHITMHTHSQVDRKIKRNNKKTVTAVEKKYKTAHNRDSGP